METLYSHVLMNINIMTLVSDLWQDIFTAGKGHLAMELGQFSVFIAQIRLFTFQSSVFTAA